MLEENLELRSGERKLAILIRPVWSSTYSIISILFSILLVIFFEFYFWNLMLPFGWLLSGMLIVGLFMASLNHTTHNWISLPKKKFLLVVFTWSLLLRLATMVLLYFVFEHFTGSPFEIGVGYDDHTYHVLGTEIASGWKHGDFGVFKYIPFGFSYIGYPIFCGILYYVFVPSTIVARIVNCIIGSFSVLLVYKMGQCLWGESVGRNAGILAMLFPNMVYYSATQHKDTILAFLVLFVTYNILKLSHDKRIKFWNIGLTLFALSSLFTFRAAVAALLIVCILIACMIYPKVQSFSNQALKTVTAVFIIVATSFLLIKIGGGESSLNRIVFGIKYRNLKIEKWATYGSLGSKYTSPSLFAAIVFPAPFPTLVDIPLDTTFAPIRSEFYHIGTILVWNILSFFALLGMLDAMKNQFRISMPLWFFTISYLAALALMNYVMDIRYRLAVAPFLIIFAALGLHRRSNNRIALWFIYLLIISILTFIYNYYRLAGRGML